MGKVLVIKGTDFSANSICKIQIDGGVVELNDKIEWIGILGGDGLDAYVAASGENGSTIGSNFILKDSLSYNRSVGVVDVSEYVGRNISLNFGQNKDSQNYIKYCAFITGKPTDSNSVLIDRFDNWLNGPVTALNTIVKTVPTGARYLCFSHTQEVESPFNGEVKILAE